jgi:hypothetical protein
MKKGCEYSPAARLFWHRQAGRKHTPNLFMAERRRGQDNVSGQRRSANVESTRPKIVPTPRLIHKHELIGREQHLRELFPGIE